MTTDQPTLVEIREAAKELGIDAADLDFYYAAVLGNVEVYAEIDALDTDAGLAFRGGDRDRIEPAENPLGAWCVQTDIQTASDGPLAGKTVVLKDNINLAGVPMIERHEPAARSCRDRRRDRGDPIARRRGHASKAKQTANRSASRPAPTPATTACPARSSAGGADGTPTTMSVFRQ
jgi:hypothetical protein